MGKETRKTIFKTLKGVGSLNYIEVRDVPMRVDAELGNLIVSHVIERVEKLAAQALVTNNIPIRGKEVYFIRNAFSLSQREFAEKLQLSHVAIFKWEKAKNRRLDLVNEVAVKALVSGMLGLDVSASLDTLVGHGAVPKRLVIEYSEESTKPRRAAGM